MKEHVEVINDSFVDYLGKTHHFTIAAVSSMLPKNGEELGVEDYLQNEVYHEVGIYIEDYGTEDYLCTVTKALRLGVSVCNPADEFNEKAGALKAISRARNSRPVLLSVDPGTINTKVVRALLEQEAEYLKGNPEKLIPGYNDMKTRYEKNKEMEAMVDKFSDVEKTVIKGIQNNPKFLDNAFKYLNWVENQKKGRNVKAS